MKFLISHHELSALLNKLQGVVSRKPTVPILANFLVEATQEGVKITATDLSLSMRCTLETKIQEEGSTALPAHLFAPLMRELTVPHIELSTNKEEITEIAAGSSRFKLHGMKGKEFPSLPDLTGSLNFKISQQTLKDMLFRTTFAVSREDSRYVLTGVLMKLAKGLATFFGTDGKKLAQIYTTVDVDQEVKQECIIPLKAAEEIVKILISEELAVVYVMNDKIAVEANRTLIVTKLLSGEYPDASHVIPTSHTIQVALHREELISLLRQISLFTIDTNQAVRFSFSEGELLLVSNAMELGEGKVSTSIDYHGPHLEIAFNPGSFLDILRHCKSEIIYLRLTDAYTPGIILENDPKQDAPLPSPLFVIMPMRLSDE